MEASYVDLADPGTSSSTTCACWMRDLAEAVRARRIVHVGGAGCALARALAAPTDGERRQHVAEVDLTSRARPPAHLGLRRGRA